MPARGRPASKNPRERRIETRINKDIELELNYVCAKTQRSKTSIIDKAIHFAYLLISDSLTQEDALYALEDKSADSSEAKIKWDWLMDALSDVRTRFRNIDYDKLEFVCAEHGYGSHEETLVEIVEYEYFKALSKYSEEEMALWKRGHSD